MSGGLPMEAYLAALAALPRVGPGTLRRLLALGDPATVWDRVRAGDVPVEAVADRRHEAEEVLGTWRSAAAPDGPLRVWERCAREGVGVSSLGSPGYPPQLVGDRRPPVVLFHRGDPDVLAARRVAVVGTRRATGYGLRVAAELGRDLAADGVCIVSGLALGIDGAAHAGALRAGGAPPVAVVAGDIGSPGPARHRGIARELVRHGAVLCEVPPGVAAEPWRFPVRNRVLAALAEVVVVVESATRGGSMHTVREALRRDRPVLAVPGPVDADASLGTNQLLAEGATVCRDAGDVRVALGLVRGDRATTAGVDPRPLPGRDAPVLDAVGWRPVTVEQVAATAGGDLGAVAAALGRLDRAGWVRRRAGWVERVARPDGG